MPEKYAILIASSEYSTESGLTRLRCPENDVDALDAILSSPDFGNFTETFVFRNASSDKIRPALNSVLVNAEKDDLILIYFSGHGKLNRLGHLCLATANTDCKALEATSVRAATIKSYFDLSYSRKKILLLDCCFSGAAGEEFAPTKGGIDGELRSISQGEGTFIMTASSSVQTAVEKEGDQYGLFTKHLVQGIRSGEADKNEDGFVDMQELYDYVHAKVREEGAQEPMQWGQDVKGKLIISRSGKESKKKRLQKIRQRLYGLGAQDALPDHLITEAMRILAAEDLTEGEQEQSSLLEQLVAEKIRPADFIVQWMRIAFAGRDEPDKLAEKVAGQQVKSTGTSVVGKGTSGDKDTPSSTKNLWNWLLHDVFADLLSRFVFAGFIVVIGWWSLKQWESRPETQQIASSPIMLQPLPKVEKMPQKDRTIGQYIDHGDGTITDTKTGLMWKRCAEGLSGDNCEDGKVESYQWNDAMQRFKDVEYAGYADWRLPTINELKTLVYCSKGKEKYDDYCKDGYETPTINQQAFPNTEATWFWSGSPSTVNSDGAWYVRFNFGVSSADSRNYHYAVRLVRDGQ
ncbi:MAG: DUF1566 domain-containing protein [Candidatus Electrothrix sp. Rat3]|nr:DUF1566 domain-containing protein [Candidatus Electrothrix rattekaaiensis]